MTALHPTINPIISAVRDLLLPPGQRDSAMDFEVVGEITDVETIAIGKSIRELTPVAARPRRRPLAQAQGKCERAAGRRFDLPRGGHWHEAHGVGRVEMKIKRFLDDSP